MRRLFPSLAFAFTLASLANPVILCAQQVGDRVMAIRDAALKQGDRIVGTFYRGQSALVEAVNADWLWVNPNVSGWVQRKHVLPLDQAITYFTNQIRQNPRDDGLYYYRATAWKHKGELDIAIADFNESIRLNPEDAAAAYDGRAYCWYLKGEYDKSLADYNYSLRLNPNDAIGYRNRGGVWQAKKEYDKAIADFNRAIQLDSRYAYPLVHRGDAWSKKGQYDKALADYQHALQVDPNSADAYGRSAWLRATCPEARFRDGERAVANATKACELTAWKDCDCIDTLAAAYAESGDFEQAIKYEQKALDLGSSYAKFVKSANERMALYRQKMPYRTE